MNQPRMKLTITLFSLIFLIGTVHSMPKRDSEKQGSRDTEATFPIHNLELNKRNVQCTDSSGNTHDEGDGNFRCTDGCNICTCTDSGIVTLTRRKCKPRPAQLPINKPQQRPIPKPEQLPVYPPIEQLPVYPPIEQLPVYPPIEQLPVYPPIEQLPEYPAIEQLPVHSSRKKRSVQCRDSSGNTHDESDGNFRCTDGCNLCTCTDSGIVTLTRKKCKPRPAQLPINKPQQRPIPKPEQLPVYPPIEQLPVYPPIEQLPVYPPIEQLPVYPPIEQLPEYPPIEQLPEYPPIEQLPVHSSRKKRSVQCTDSSGNTHDESDGNFRCTDGCNICTCTDSGIVTLTRRKCKPRPAQLPINKPQQRPIPKPEQLPVYPPIEQLPVYPPIEQLPVYPPIEQLPVYPPVEQLPVHTSEKRTIQCTDSSGNTHDESDGNFRCTDDCNICTCTDSGIVTLTRRKCKPRPAQLPINKPHQGRIPRPEQLPVYPPNEQLPAELPPIEQPSVFPPGSCRDRDGSIHANGTSWTCTDGCNTCSCYQGLVASTFRLCRPRCKSSDGNFHDVGTDYQEECNTCTCHAFRRRGRIQAVGLCTLALCPPAEPAQLPADTQS